MNTDVRSPRCAITAISRARASSAYFRTRMPVVGFAVALATPGAFDQALAQDYPSRSVTLVVPYGPGGGADVVGRIISQPLSRFLQQQVIVDNRAGAGGTIGAATVARAASDGYTLMLGSNTLALNVSLRKNLPYDFEKDFVAVGMLSFFPYVLVVHPALPVLDVKGLIALARKNPGALFHSSSGNGSTPHLAAEVFKMAVGIKMVHVPYKSAAPALTDLVSGQVQVGFASINSVLPMLKTKRLRALAVTSAKRQAAAADVPTLVELGYKDVEVTTWNALFVPARTPAAIISRLNAETVKAVNDPEVRARFIGLGVEPISSTQHEAEAFVKEEVVRWGKVVKASGATID